MCCRLFADRSASARAPAPLELSALRAIVRVLSIEFWGPVPVLRSPLSISPGVACWCLIGSASSSHERRARDMDLPTVPGLFIDDNDWFRPARTSPFRPASKSCVMRHSRGYSRSAEQQSHITRALCTGSARGRVRTCMEVPDPGRASRRGHTHPVFHE